jgi:hypothetical protein
MRGGIARRNSAEQQDNLRENQFRDAARIGEWRIEHRYATLLSGRDIHLIRPDAEAPDGYQLVFRLENGSRNLSRRPDAQDVTVPDCLNQLRFGECFLAIIDAGVTIGPERLNGARMDALEEENPDLFLGK